MISKTKYFNKGLRLKNPLKIPRTFGVDILW